MGAVPPPTEQLHQQLLAQMQQQQQQMLLQQQLRNNPAASALMQQWAARQPLLGFVSLHTYICACKCVRTGEHSTSIDGEWFVCRCRATGATREYAQASVVDADEKTRSGTRVTCKCLHCTCIDCAAVK
jgi:hypothetical protein